MMNTQFEGVSPAEPQDEDGLYALLMLLHEENGLYPVDESSVRAFIRYGTQKRGGIIGVIRGETSIEGSVGLGLEPAAWYTKDFALIERWNFVHPEARKSSHAVRLIEYAKWISEKLAVPLQMGVISTHQTEAKLRLYGRFLTPVGGLFMHNVPKGLDLANTRVVVPQSAIKEQMIDKLTKRSRSSVPNVGKLN